MFASYKKKQTTMTTVYVSGGKLGDFIQQLSIVYERFLLDRKPAILYIDNRGDPFTLGVQKAYEDLLPIISKQYYIKEFKVYQGEPYDVDLSSWRKHIWHGSQVMDNYLTWMKKEYNLLWGKHAWIHNIPLDLKWNDHVVINTTHYRFPDMLNWFLLCRRCPKEKIVFVAFDPKEYQHFSSMTRTNFRFHKPTSLLEFCIIIRSCLLFVGSLSAPLSFAFGLHAPMKIGLHGKRTNHFDYQVFHNIGTVFPKHCLR